MLHFSPRLGAAALGALFVFTSYGASGGPVVIDSEQKALAATAVATRAQSATQGDFLNITMTARSYAESALRALNAVTTPAALVAAGDAGVSIPCATSGNQVASMARKLPRVLKFKWNACKYVDIDGYASERNGEVEIVLLSDTFTPQKVASIRIGTPTQDFTSQRLIIYDDQISDETYSMNLRMVGLINTRRAFSPYSYFDGEYAFETTGFLRTHGTTTSPTGEWPPYESDYRIYAEFLLASGSLTYSNAYTHFVDELNLPWGTIGRASVSSYEPNEVSSEYQVLGLKLRDESDFRTGARSRSMDGAIDYRFSSAPGLSSGCTDGLYTFRTRAPLAGNLFGPGALESGNMLINGTTTASFYSAANVPPTLPVPQNGMLAAIDVRNLGSFNYDIAAPYQLGFMAQCVF
jgi:hypothetical protein